MRALWRLVRCWQRGGWSLLQRIAKARIADEWTPERSSPLRGFRQPKRGMWKMEWVNFRQPLPATPHFNVPWKPLGVAALFVVLGYLLPFTWAAVYFLPVFGVLALRRGNFPNDHANADSWYVAVGKLNDYADSNDSLLSQTINAGHTKYAAATFEASIALADADCFSQGKTILYIPLFMLPYDVTLCPPTPGIQRTREGGLVSVFDVKAYGAAGTGVDDYNGIQAAVDAACYRGGTVSFPSLGGEIYGLATGVLVSSLYPVVLRGDMLGGGGEFQTGANSSFIKPLAGFNSATDMFRYASPSGDRAEGGGGAVIGLSFFDPTHRTIAIRSALRLEDFNLSLVRDCSFHEILGSAIITDFCVMSSIDRCIIRYNGNTGKSAVQMGVTNGSGFVTQSTSLRDCRLEVNYLAPYISMPYAPGASQEANKISKCGFEADTSIADSNQLFMSIEAENNSISDCHFYRNTGTSVSVSGAANRNNFTSCHFNSDPGTNPQFSHTGTGTWNTLTSCHFTGGISNTTGFGFTSVGFIKLVGCDFYAGGKIVFTGAYARMIGCTVRNLAATGANYAVDMQGGNSSFIGGQITNNAIGGIKLSSTGPVIIGAEVSNNTGIGILVNSGNATVVGNIGTANTGGDLGYGSSGNRASTVRANTFLSAGTGVVTGDRYVIDGWYQDNVVASQTDVALARLATTTEAPTRWIAGRGGCVTAVWVKSSLARTAGTLTVKIFNNGSVVGSLTAVLDGTNTTFKATTQNKGTTNFVAGDELELRVTTDAGWLPVTADIRAAMEIET
jgi:hypothetical protein